MMRIRIRIRIHGSAFRNCGSGSGSGSRLIYEQISYTRCKSKTFNFFYFFIPKKISGRRLLIGLEDQDRLQDVLLQPTELSSSTDLSRLLAIFLYPWIRIWIRIKMRIRIRIQRPKNMRIHADPDPDPDPKHCTYHFRTWPNVKEGNIVDISKFFL